MALSVIDQVFTGFFASGPQFFQAHHPTRQPGKVEKSEHDERHQDGALVRTSDDDGERGEHEHRTQVQSLGVTDDEHFRAAADFRLRMELGDGLQAKARLRVKAEVETRTQDLVDHVGQGVQELFVEGKLKIKIKDADGLVQKFKAEVRAEIKGVNLFDGGTSEVAASAIRSIFDALMGGLRELMGPFFGGGGSSALPDAGRGALPDSGGSGSSDSGADGTIPPKEQGGGGVDLPASAPRSISSESLAGDSVVNNASVGASGSTTVVPNDAVDGTGSLADGDTTVTAFEDAATDLRIQFATALSALLDSFGTTFFGIPRNGAGELRAFTPFFASYSASFRVGFHLNERA